MKRTTSLLLFAFLLFLQTLNAQGDFPCATDFLHQQASQNPLLFQKQQLLEQEAYDFFSQKTVAERSSQVLTVPVVVHIIHDNGPENLSDAQVQQAITWLNQAFANQTIFDQGSGTDVGIQFCLAQRSPANQPTNGITRDQSPLTVFNLESEQLAMKNINRWQPTNYINIWVVRDICSVTYGCGIVAYAYYPSSHGSDLDGIVVEANVINSLGNVSGLVHEMGHYFGLYHSFEGGCTNNDCLSDGDRVCDTPPDQSTAAVPCNQSVNTCSTDAQSGLASDQPDMTLNHMDYGHLNCKHDFTQGQADRMNFFLNGARKSLLDSKGCLPPCPLPVLADFNPGDTTILAGQTLFFDNNSQNAVNFSWSLNGVPFGNQQNAAYLFDSAGVFTVQLVAQPLNGQLCAAASAQATVQVTCPAVANFTLSNLSPEEGQTVFVTNTSQNATQFEWFVNGVSQGAVLDSIAFSPEGVYVLKLLAGDFYCKDESQIVLTVRDSCKNPGFQLGIKNGSYNVFLSGNSSPIASLDDGSVVCGKGIGQNHKKQVFFSKIDAIGNVVWSKSYGDTVGQAEVLALQSSPDGGFAAVVMTGPLFGIVKLSGNGDLLWFRYLIPDSLTYWLHTLICNPDGSIVACGYANKDSKRYLLVTKFSSDGNLVWAKRALLPAYNWVEGKSLARTFDNGYIIVCNANGSSVLMQLDSSGTILWAKSLASSLPNYSNKIRVSTDGSILLAGFISIGNSHRAWLSKISIEGDLLWSRYILLPGPADSRLHDIEEGSEGYFTGVGMATDGYAVPVKEKGGVFRFDTAGHCLWLQKYGNMNSVFSYNYFNDIEPAIDGSHFIGGTNYLDSNYVSNLWVIKTDAAGFTGSCEPGVIVPFMNTLQIEMASETHSSLPAPQIDSTMLQVYDITLNIDTLCMPECYVSSEICNNNLDDDEDGLFDCLDPDCNCPADACAPGEAKIWYFGDHAGLDFNTEPPTVLTDGQTSNDCCSSATVSDVSGNLLFYTDGLEVFNRFHQIMPNGNSFSIPSERETFIIPYPGKIGEYFVFVLSQDGLSYSRVDMKLDNGLGDVVSDEEGIALLSDSIPLSLRMTAAKSCSFEGYWLVCKALGFKSKFIAFRIDENGLNLNPVISLGGESFSTLVQMKISPDGKKIVSAGHNSVFMISDFDGLTGSVITPPTYLLTHYIYNPIGFEFSPSGRYLYVSAKEVVTGTKSQVYQYDLYAGGKNEINNSRKVLATINASTPNGPYAASMQLAPNGKIYIANVNNSFSAPASALHIIHQPNLPAPACQFQENGLVLTGTPGGLVNIPQNLFAQPAIAFSQNTPDTICKLDSTYTYAAEKSGCFQTDSILWKMEGLSGTLNHDDENGWIKFDAPGAGRLIVTAHTECGIVADTLQIVVAEPFDKILDLGPDQVVCDNGVFTFNAGSGFSRYRWQNGSPDSVLTTLLPGQYWVDVWDACGNRQTDTVTVSISPATVLDLGLDQAGCPDLAATFERPGFFSRWQWSPAGFTSCDTCSSVTVSPAATTSWTVVAQTDDGCISVDTLTFEIQDTLFFQLDTSVCRGQAIELFGTILPADTTAHFFFQNPDLGCDTLLTVNVLGLDAPFLEIEKTICANALFTFNGIALPADTTAVFLLPGISGECDSVVTVTVNSWPPLAVTLPPDTTLRIGATLILNAETTGTEPLTFAWSPADGLSCADCPDPEISPLETMLYTLQVSDANGCSASDSMLVTVENVCTVIIPNAFTPNGDGINDFFYPRTDPCVRLVRTWRVVSRWGEIVFEKNNFEPDNQTLGWNGNRANGEPFPSDVLVWYAELEYFDGKKEVRKGDVALLR